MLLNPLPTWDVYEGKVIKHTAAHSVLPAGQVTAGCCPEFNLWFLLGSCEERTEIGIFSVQRWEIVHLLLRSFLQPGAPQGKQGGGRSLGLRFLGDFHTLKCEEGGENKA